ncbi:MULTISPECIES: maleylpyruvate isomerase family mycothiol-dependent enzyme [unclassified Geodermatophilus]|uniref:maleylpyruvate isomerase family mycothiol-dependent enzyme n=1 Tax=unclassified Geodermatophilus TaxID=2637632 RepID=UPI003EEAE2D1
MTRPGASAVARRRPRVAHLDDVRDERLSLADLLDTLSAEEWATPSLCAGWTVHDVVAHLTLSPQQRIWPTLVRVARTRGDFDRAEAEWARERAARYRPAELVGQLRATAGVDSRLRLSGPLDPLVDILVHGQDVARPLCRPREVPARRALPALRHVWSSAFYRRPDRRFRGLRLVATDADWSAGEGSREVRGPVGDLLLLATNRPAALPGLTGPGVAEAAARLA